MKCTGFYVSLKGHNNIFIFQQKVFFLFKKQKEYFSNTCTSFVGNPFLPSEKGFYVAVKPAPDKIFFFKLASIFKCGAGEGWRRSVGPIM